MASRRSPRSPRALLTRVALALAVVALVGVVGLIESRLNVEDSAPTTHVTQSPQTGTAMAALATLNIDDSGSKAPYDRDNFGAPWADVDGNGCDTRNDILTRDLSDVAYRDASACVVAAGSLDDPYTGSQIMFVQGRATSAAIQIDHVVALKNAWLTGAETWDAATLEQFANDPLNLLAADGPANQSKGAKDASQWLPSNEAFECRYVARQIAVKASYSLDVTSAEDEAMRAVLATCPTEPLPQ